jgi:hypothetical protein
MYGPAPSFVKHGFRRLVPGTFVPSHILTEPLPSSADVTASTP